MYVPDAHTDRMTIRRTALLHRCTDHSCLFWGMSGRTNISQNYAMTEYALLLPLLPSIGRLREQPQVSFMLTPLPFSAITTV